jgi:hypothetical protein
MQQTRAAPATLEAVLERITYAYQETGDTVARGLSIGVKASDA